MAVLCLVATMVFFAPASDAAGPNPVVIMETSMGRVIVMLYPKEAPITVANFLKYVDAGFYDKTIFHRVINMESESSRKKDKESTFNVVQGGGYAYPMRHKRPLYPPIVNEDMKALQNEKGTIGMARTQDPDSATSQFFFNVEDNPIFDPTTVKKQWGEPDELKSSRGYCAFGKVIRGWEVVEKIHKVKTTKMGQHENVPKDPVFIKRAYRAK